MRVGFSIYESLSPAYELFRGPVLLGTAAEVFPEATAVLLAGRLRNGDESKQAFRSQILENNGVDASVLPTVDRVDAALAALTGLLALEGTYSKVGDPAEGVMILPVTHLPSSPLLRERATPRVPGVQMTDATPSTRGQECLCGCGAIVRRRFLPGHDAKLKSRLLRAHAGGVEMATEVLKDLGWLPTDD
jgi:hypothetical protein